MSSKIRDIEVRPVCVPMPHPHRTASGVVTESPLVLLTVHTDQGPSGHGIIFTYTSAALQPVADLIGNIAPLILGDPLAPVDIGQKLTCRFRLLGTQGLVGMALAGIDMALWDALARLHDVPLYRLLGAEAKPLSVYGAIGYDGPLQSAETAEDFARRGFRGIKAKIGYPTVREDLDTIRAIRSAVGTDISLMVDYNQSLTPVEAIERLRMLDGEGLAWIEEPTLAHDFQGHARIANQISTPIQCGENWGLLDATEISSPSAS